MVEEDDRRRRKLGIYTSKLELEWEYHAGVNSEDQSPFYRELEF
jgi:hypothetical protein